MFLSALADIMTREVQVIGPEQSLQQAAQLMDQLNIGALPVCEGGRLIGIVTDRDITVRGTAAGLGPTGACVADVMTKDPASCEQGLDVDAAMRLMGEAQVRRLPVTDADRKLVGIVSLGDLATRQARGVDVVVRQISTPSEPDGGPASS